MAMTGALIGSAVWSTLTGDTFFPSLVGAAFATYLRAQSRETGLDAVDLAVGLITSLTVGLIAGPYIGSQLPHGDGVVGVGSLIASFICVGFFTKLYEADWDVGAVLKQIVDALPTGKQKK